MLCFATVQKYSLRGDCSLNMNSDDSYIKILWKSEKVNDDFKAEKQMKEEVARILLKMSVLVFIEKVKLLCFKDSSSFYF